MQKALLSIQNEEFSISLIEDNGGIDGYIVFTRVLSNFDLDDVDFYNQLSTATMRFVYLANCLMTSGNLPNINNSNN